MWPFNRKKKKVRKTAESSKKQEIPLEIEKTYAQLSEEYRQLVLENAEAEDECAKDGLTWREMLFKTKEMKEKMAVIDKKMRKIQEPSLTYNKKWKGQKIPLEDFVAASVAKEITDLSGEGYYAAETAKTDIIVRPSDILENIYRTDFPYVLWIPNQ